MYRQLKGVLLVLLSACGFGATPLFALYAYQYGINVPTLLLLRFALAALFLLIFLFASRRRRAAAGVRARELFYLFLLGGICYTLSSTFYFTAICYITASLATLILYTYPILVVLMDCMLEFQKPAPLTTTSGGISFAGVLLMVGTVYGAINGVGVFLALGAALTYSTFIILGHRVIKQVAPLTATTFVTAFAGVGILVTSFFTTPLDFSFRAPAWGYIAGLALFSTVVAILFFFWGLELLGPVRVSILSMSEPLFTVLGTVILLQERLTAVQLFGGAAVLAGAVLVTWPKKQRDPAC
jgi:drug/metabolite transporter (DMT)-like permease